MVSHYVQDNAKNLGNTMTAEAIYGYGDNFFLHVRCIPLSFVIRVGNTPTFTSLSGSIVSQVIMNGTNPVFAFLSGIKRNNDNYHVNYL